MITLQKVVSEISERKRQNEEFLYLRSLLIDHCPVTWQALRIIDSEYSSVKQPKGYNLIKRENRKTGFVYYVRYWHEGKMLASKWCTHTNNLEKAIEFAVKNKERIIARYLGKDRGEITRFFTSFYDKDNPVFQSEYKRIKMTEVKRKWYASILKRKFIPLLTEKKVRAFTEITVPVLNDFQDTLLQSGIKAQTVNDELVSVKKVMAYLARKGIIHDDPCIRLKPVPEKKEDKKTHGCYELEKVKGVFDKNWKNERAYLLDLLIYSTGMRNSEIKSFTKGDIINIRGSHFIDLKKSKTENGIRLVPLHNRVYEKVMDYSKGKDENKPVFDIKYRCDKEAAQELASRLNVDEKYQKEQNITFYSGRHFWKTMMNAGGLGEDAEEVFMGHTVSSNVAKLYNHRDKQGKELVVEKAKQIFAILDRYLFSAKP